MNIQFLDPWTKNHTNADYRNINPILPPIIEWSPRNGSDEFALVIPCSWPHICLQHSGKISHHSCDTAHYNAHDNYRHHSDHIVHSTTTTGIMTTTMPVGYNWQKNDDHNSGRSVWHFSWPCSLSFPFDWSATPLHSIALPIHGKLYRNAFPVHLYKISIK